MGQDLELQGLLDWKICNPRAEHLVPSQGPSLKHYPKHYDQGISPVLNELPAFASPGLGWFRLPGENMHLRGGFGQFASLSRTVAGSRVAFYCKSA